MWRAICFDLDGTLARYQGDFDQLLDGLRTDLGLLACDFATFRSRLSSELRREGPGTLTTAVAATLELLEQRLPEDLPTVVERALERYSTDLRLLPGAGELLKDLRGRGIPLALVTNGPSDMQRSGIAALGIASHFEAVLVSGDREVGVRKPDRLIFELACKRLGVGVQETLMVGDDLEKDVEGAIGAGLAALQVSDSRARDFAGLVGAASDAGTVGTLEHFAVGGLSQARTWLLGKLAEAGS